MTLCSVDDVKSLFNRTELEAITDAKVATVLLAAEAEVYAHITPCYFNSCPFAAPVPPILRWDCAWLAKGMLVADEVGPSEPNKTDYGSALIRDIRKDLEKIVACLKGVTNEDGSLVERDIPCPKGSPNAAATGSSSIVSNTGMESKGNITIFDLNDVPENIRRH